MWITNFKFGKELVITPSGYEEKSEDGILTISPAPLTAGWELESWLDLHKGPICSCQGPMATAVVREVHRGDVFPDGPIPPPTAWGVAETLEGKPWYTLMFWSLGMFEPIKVGVVEHIIRPLPKKEEQA